MEGIDLAVSLLEWMSTNCVDVDAMVELLELIGLSNSRFAKVQQHAIAEGLREGRAKAAAETKAA